MSLGDLGLPNEDRRREEDARAERILMGRLLAIMFVGAAAFIVIWASFVSGMDLFSLANAGVCLLMAAISFLFSRISVSRYAFIPLVLIGTALQVAEAIHTNRTDAGFFLLLPAMYTAIFYWRNVIVCSFGVAVCMAAYIIPPLMIGGDVALARVTATAPVFLALTLTIGYLGSKSNVMLRRRARFQSTISSLLVALQERDGYTADHSEETVDLALAVGDELRIGDEQRDVLVDVALLHDIGKIGIPNEILNKRSALNDHEWEFMKLHPEIGERIVSPVPGFLPVSKAIRHEHERWDGNGYPDGLAGESIPLASRIVLVCDAFHAMITDRPYRKSIGLEQARAEMVRHAGTQFDPEVVDALLAVIDGGNIPDSVGRAAWDGVTNGVPAGNGRPSFGTAVA